MLISNHLNQSLIKPHDILRLHYGISIRTTTFKNTVTSQQMFFNHRELTVSWPVIRGSAMRLSALGG